MSPNVVTVSNGRDNISVMPTLSDVLQHKLADPADRAVYEQAYARKQLAMQLGDKIRVLREQHGWSQAELARRAGLKQPAVARLEVGGAEPRFDTLARLGAALDTELVVEFRPRAAGAAS